MSYTEIMIEGETGEFTAGERFRNSHGWAPFIWDALVKKYEVPGAWGAKWGNLWAAVEGGTISVEPWEHAVLYCTYDYALVKREDLDKVASAMRLFHDAFADAGRACHLLGIAASMVALADDDACVSVGFYGTSICNNLFDRVYACPECDEVGRPYSTKIDTEWWWVETEEANDEPNS